MDRLEFEVTSTYIEVFCHHRIFSLHQYLSQRSNSSVFHRPHSRTNYFYFSYVPSVITVWNTLPVGIRSSSSVSVFKHSLLHLAHVLYYSLQLFIHVASHIFVLYFLSHLYRKKSYNMYLLYGTYSYSYNMYLLYGTVRIP